MKQFTLCRKLVFLSASMAVAWAAPVDAGELPATYQRIKYLKASSTQQTGTDPYVDTGVVPHANLHVVAKVKVNGIAEYWFGCWDTSFNFDAYAVCNDSSSVYTAYGDGDWGTFTPEVGVGEHTIEFNKNVISVDGEVKKTYTSKTFAKAITSTLYLFSQNRNGAATGVCGGVQLISCQIYDNTDDSDVPLRDFVPCYVSGDKTQFGLYDLVEGAFHPMGNTSYAHNSFELGPDAGDIDATARDESAVADGTPYNIAVSVIDPAEGAGCSYEWSTDGVTYSSVFDGVTTPGTHTVYCRISATDYKTKVVSGKVYLYDGAPSWTYSGGRITDGNWSLNVSASGSELTVNSVASVIVAKRLDLSAPIEGGYTIVSVGGFSSRSGLCHVILPETLRTIRGEAFATCSDLETVTPFMPESLTSVGQEAFRDCAKLGGSLVLGMKRTDFTLSGATHQFSNCEGISNVWIRGNITSVPNSFLCEDVALKTVRIDSRTSYTIGSLAFGNWNGHYPQIEDLYLRGYATSISTDSIGRDARTVRVWLARETPEWKAWIAEKVTPWADLSADVQAEYVTRFGAGAQKPVGVTVSGVFNKPQWILRYSATPGVILYVR